MNPEKVMLQEQQTQEFTEAVIQVNRTSKKTTGGNKIGFAVLAVAGNKKGKVGVGLGKAGDVASAIRKAVATAKKHLVTVPIIKGTIPFGITMKHGAARLILKPAPMGSGIIAGGAVRAVVSAAGIENISSKVLGTGNKISNVYGTLHALEQIAMLQEKFIAKKGKTK